MDVFEEEYNKILEQKKFLGYTCLGIFLGVLLPAETANIIITQTFGIGQSSLTSVYTRLR